MPEFLSQLDILGFLKTVAIFLVVLSVLIAFHEWGHFLIARLVGVKVLTFSIGFGPKLWRRVSGDTEYCVSAIPLGGYVRLFGDDPGETVDAKDQAQAFLYQSTSRKLAIVAAGPFFNLIMAYLIFAAILTGGMSLYVPAFDSLMPVVESVSEDSPAEAAGLRPGDRIVLIDDHPISTWMQISEFTSQNAGTPLTFVVERGDERTVMIVTPEPKMVEARDGSQIEVGQIGVGKSSSGVQIEADNPAEAVVRGGQATWYWTSFTVVSLAKLIQGIVPLREVGGPILIAQASAKAAESGIINLLMFMAIISVNLAVLNFLPIPVLDGGHIMFFLLEAVMGRPLNMRTREIAQRVGIALLLVLMVLAFSNDIMRNLGP